MENIDDEPTPLAGPGEGEDADLAGDGEDDLVEPDNGEDEDVPLPVEEDEEPEMEDLEDDTVPLSSPDLVVGAKHCITHFLELILAGGVTAYGFGSTRKQKKEIDDLKRGKRG
ncbi:hypothetical protein [uncultured Acetatifactor sp.]|jgi:hypothetical protein|uniref:hypothetical protein n=1 Tax=uncultured Acetatifactor sp. TaxID=1671927 RepID=UPI0026238463|nr:hypothetical protein [uncultured Acetatifactor sp.]